MKVLQMIVAVLTVLLLLIEKKFIFAGICPPKKSCFQSHLRYCGDSKLASSSFAARGCRMCLRDVSIYNDEDISMPKYKKDPKIKVDNEDIGDYPVE
ncbi:hypothetical protein evm_001986 [Chilo suppressalis]|nr:hypothetical protein evm_001986 [Chilo suppressalis]